MSKAFRKSKNKVRLKRPSSMLIIHLLVVFKRLVSVECSGLNPDWLFESKFLGRGIVVGVLTFQRAWPQQIRPILVLVVRV